MTKSTKGNLVCALFACLALAACKQKENEPSGNEKDNAADSAERNDNQKATRLVVSPDSADAPLAGGTVTVTVASDADWTVASDQDWCVPSLTSGHGDATLTLTVAVNPTDTPDTARVTVAASALRSVAAAALRRVVTVARPRKPVTDCQGNVYPVVKIGDQYWMGENLKCTQYDTESERAGATLTTSDSYVKTPYYVDAREATSVYDGVDLSAQLTPALRAKLGLLYNWPAAMGHASEAETQAQTSDYEGDRQGICPNGWHVPSRAEWNTLYNYIHDETGTLATAYHLKSTAGWYSDAEDDGNGPDTYGFTALPAGAASGSGNIYNVGVSTLLWTSGAEPSDNSAAYVRWMDYNVWSMGESNKGKGVAYSVRCIRND